MSSMQLFLPLVQTVTTQRGHSLVCIPRNAVFVDIQRQAALASAATFAVGAALPLLVVLASPDQAIVWSVSATSLLFLAVLGTLSARAGGAPVARAAVRVLFWGALAMAITAAVGMMFGAVV